MRRIRRFTEHNLIFTLLVLCTIAFVLFGGYALFLQAQRANPQFRLSRNWKAWYILGCYGALGLVSLVLSGRRARNLALKLKRIPQTEDKAPPVVRKFIQDEYWRASAIAYVSQPKNSKQKGWGTPGTLYGGINFRRVILDTVSIIDAQARVIVPRLPALRPHVRMIQHLGALAALFPSDGVSCLKTYDATVQLARYSKEEPTEAEFERGMRAYQELLDM
ncbi:hypothetical protein K439DRAFT_1646589 [Ramaria rubella]|nr:hypothetical protein K439DRAFT_1646589 [Ramaria rubella]